MLDERTQKAEAWHQNAANRAPYSKPADPITCATFAQDVLEGRASVSQAHEHKHQPLIFGPASLVGGGLTSERERMAAQVFQPGYRYVLKSYTPETLQCLCFLYCACLLMITLFLVNMERPLFTTIPSGEHS